MATPEQLRAVAAPLLAAEGLELWDVEHGGGVLRFLVDRPGGVDLDVLTAASGLLSPLLDEHPELTPSGPYQLEVSSPGLERTLRTPDQYRRYIGGEVTVKTTGPVAGSRRHRGRLLAVSDGGVSIETDGSGAGVVELRYDEIDRARTVLVWPVPAARAGNRRATAGRSQHRPSAVAEPTTKDPTP